MSEPIQQPTEAITYPTWQPELRAVMLEIDPIKVKEKLALAESAMAKRAAQLTKPEDEAELRAMKEEAERMKLALAEILSEYPKL
jgi:hypothetical protein